MKSFIRKILLVTSLLSIITCIKVDAENLNPPNVQLLGNAKSLVHIPGDNLFLYHPNMLPGDSVKRILEIKNKHKFPYELFLKAKRVSQKEEYDLLDKLDLKIKYKDKVIYQALANGENKLTDGISLGVINPGQEEKLVAEVTLDGHLTGNEYKNKYVQVDWIFTANRKENNITIKTDENKFDDWRESPKTGESSIFIYVVLALLSIILLFMNRKKDN